MGGRQKFRSHKQMRNSQDHPGRECEHARKEHCIVKDVEHEMIPPGPLRVLKDDAVNKAKTWRRSASNSGRNHLRRIEEMQIVQRVKVL
jgi:hypothetical protein